MENSKILNKINSAVALSATILTGLTFRLIPHPPNFAPIGALALFSGANIDGMGAFIIPLVSMILSDLILGFHDTMIFVYGSFAMMVILGKLIKNQWNFKTLIFASFASSILFFAVTNLGVWATGTMYQRNIQGLMEAYVMGLPFLRNTVLGDIFYTLLFFYGYKTVSNFAAKKLSSYSTTLSSSNSNDSFKI